MNHFELEHLMQNRQSELLAEGHKRQLRNSVSRAESFGTIALIFAGVSQWLGTRPIRKYKPETIPLAEVSCCAL